MEYLGKLVHIERSKLGFKLALWSIIGVFVAIAFEALTSLVALQVALGVVIVILVGRKGGLRARMATMGVVTVIGGLLGLLSYFGAETAWQAALVLAVASYVTGLAYAISPAAGGAGYLLLLWTMAVLIGQAYGGEPLGTSIAFLVGGVIAMVLMALSMVVKGRKATAAAAPEDLEDADAAGTKQQVFSIGALLTSPTGVWSAIRALLVIVTVLIGFAMTSDLDPYWASIVLLIVFLPDLKSTTFKAIQRGTGTVVGVLTATAVLTAFPTENVIIVATLIGTFGTLVFYLASYLIYAFFLTNTVLFYYWLAVDHEVSAPSIRLVATAIGIALSFVGVALLRLRAKKSTVSA